MYTGSLGTISNREDWIQSIDVVDENGGDVDISAAQITLAVRKRNDTVPALTATVGDGIALASPRFTFTFDVGDMRALAAGTYDVGCVVTVSGTTTQLIVGTVAIVDGVVDA